MKLKSSFSFLASLAAAAVVFASCTCQAAILIKPKASNKYKNHVLVSWKAYKGAKGYTVYRAYEKKNIKYAEVIKTCSKNTRKIKDTKAKFCGPESQKQHQEPVLVVPGEEMYNGMAQLQGRILGYVLHDA